MVNLLDLIAQKIELFRLEQRYTKRRNRRSTFVSDATYVDGEYIYATPSPTLSKRPSMRQFYTGNSEDGMSTTTEGSRSSPRRARFDGGEGSEESRSGEGDKLKPQQQQQQRRGWGSARMSKRRSMLTVREVRWEERS